MLVQSNILKVFPGGITQCISPCVIIEAACGSFKDVLLLMDMNMVMSLGKPSDPHWTRSGHTTIDLANTNKIVVTVFGRLGIGKVNHVIHHRMIDHMSYSD